MISTTPEAVALKATLDELINGAVHSDLAALDKIYHDDMKILMLAPDGSLHVNDKPAFMKFVKTAMDDATPNTWAKYHSITTDGNTGHIFLSRRNGLMGAEREITLSIDFVFEDKRWQITREVIVFGNETGA